MTYRAQFRACISATLSLLVIMFVLGPVQPGMAQVSSYELGPQDKIRVKAFEWRPSKDEIYTWEALNDEYVIGADGYLMLPLVGDVMAAGITTSSLAGVVRERLKEGLGLVSSPDISVEIVQFRPFYITGQVDKPGEYAFRPGLTVLQAVAIAGGLTRPRDVGMLRIEREVIASEGDLRTLRIERDNLEARRARLEAEFANLDHPVFPQHLAGDAAGETTKATIRQEQLIFAARNDAFKTQTVAHLQLKAHLEKEVISLNAQLQMEDRQISLVKRELQGLTSLVERGLAIAPRQMVLERTLASVESDKLKMGVSLLKAHQEIAKTDIGLLELKNKRANEITLELRETNAKFDAIVTKEATAQQLLEETEFASPLLVQRSRTRARPTYTISRAAMPETEPVVTNEGGPVRPGDTLSVEIPLPDFIFPARRGVKGPDSGESRAASLTRRRPTE